MTNIETLHCHTHAPPLSGSSSSNVTVILKDDTPIGEMDQMITYMEKQGCSIYLYSASTPLSFSATMSDFDVEWLTSERHVNRIEADGPVSDYTKYIVSGK